MQHDPLDIQIVPESSLVNAGDLTAPWETSAADAVANGRLYIKNGRGEFEQVAQMYYWKQVDGEGQYLTVLNTGVEMDENGEVVRRWHSANNQKG